MKTIKIIAGMCILLTQVNAQGVVVGDKCPDLVVNNIIRSPNASFKISDFKGKLLILNFMTTSCYTCMQSLPKFDSLQKIYRGRLQIIPVTYEKREKVEPFFMRNNVARQTSLPVVVEDSILKAHFPHKSIPHEVWINAEGVVTAITNNQYVTPENIDMVLKGKFPRWPVKRDVTGFDYDQPIFAINRDNIPEESLPGFTFHSAFSNYMDGIGRRVKVVKDTLSKTTKISMLNVSMIQMYLNILELPPSFPKSQMILNIKGKENLFYNPDTDYREEWNRENAFCYEAVMPIEADKKKYLLKILTDLDLFFNKNARVETRKVKCFVLYGDAANRTADTSQKEQANASRVHFSGLLYRLNDRFGSVPVINETANTRALQLQISSGSFESFSELKKELERYGISLKEEERELKVFVLSD